MKNYIEIPSPMGGVIRKGQDLAGVDSGYSSVNEFIKKHKHTGWSLSIFDTNTENNMEIECDLSEMANIVAYIYNLEHAYPITFIGENPLSESYVVGMNFTRGRISIPSLWKSEDGKLINLAYKDEIVRYV